MLYILLASARLLRKNAAYTEKAGNLTADANGNRRIYDFCGYGQRGRCCRSTARTTFVIERRARGSPSEDADGLDARGGGRGRLDRGDDDNAQHGKFAVPSAEPQLRAAGGERGAGMFTRIWVLFTARRSKAMALATLVRTATEASAM